MSLYSLKNVTKVYGRDEAAVKALDGINLEIPAGKFIVILGPSGSGKSTLLNIIGGMDTPSSGEILFNGENIGNYSARQLTNYRKKQVGFVFQSYNLLADLTARENVEFSTEIAKLPRDGAAQALGLVGLSERLNHYPSEMSGGEQQRVSIARGVAKKPAVLLCDEPTGALDYRTSQDILQLICDINERFGNTIIMVTHNESIKYIANHICVLHDGIIKEDYMNTDRKRVNEVDW